MDKIIFLLAAGYGKRLRPFTHYLPKPLYPVKGENILIRNMNFLKQFQLPIYINCAFHPNALLASVNCSPQDKITILYEVEPVGVLPTLWTVSNLIGHNKFIFLISSDLFLLDLNSIKEALTSDIPSVFIKKNKDYAGACFFQSQDLLKTQYHHFKDFFFFMRKNYSHRFFHPENLHIGQ